MRSSFTAVALLLVFCLADACCGIVSAQKQRSPGASTVKATADLRKDDEQPDGEKARLLEAEDHMQRLELRRANGDGDEIKLIDRPLLAFVDSARIHNNGTLWAWGQNGRPAAFMELWQGSDRPDVWRHSITLSGQDRLVLTTTDGRRWTPPQQAPEFAAIADAPAPAEARPARLRQLKDLARRFTAHEFWDPNNSRFELRVLPQPVHRYHDPAEQIQEGGVFVVAHGTNPEAVLLVEARGASLAEARWQYALVRSSSAEVRVELDGREVWSVSRVPNIGGGPTETYWLFLTATEAAPSPQPLVPSP